MLDRLKAPEGAKKRKKRLGRGEGSGLGKSSGRGTKGQRSRAGSGPTPGFEGGQMPLQRRLPKRGFTNIFRVPNRIVNVGDIASRFDSGDTVDPEALVSKGLVRKGKGPVKVLGEGALDKSLTVKAHMFSRQAREKIEAAGGKAEVL